MNQLKVIDELYPIKPLIIPELDNYQILVSYNGDVYTPFHKEIRKSGRPLNVRGRKLIPSIGKGYYKVVLMHNSKKKTISVHRLVAMAWLPNYCDELQINHKNGNKLDNDYRNLEMCTVQENISHSIRTGLKPKLKRDKKGRFAGKVGDNNGTDKHL